MTVETPMWQVISNGRPVGEFPEHYLVQLAAGGRVDPNDLFWRRGMTVAAPAHTLAPFDRYLQGPRLGDDPAMRWLLPVGRAPWAIAAGYLGLFSLLLVFGPFAVGAGVLGLRQIRRNPRLHGRGRATFGIIAGSLATLVLLLIVLSAA
ncbi:MAG: DUF4190 domain-containing protein [Jatrophihabitantaceae bacterium]